jgi:hypothetical protein
MAGKIVLTGGEITGILCVLIVMAGLVVIAGMIINAVVRVKTARIQRGLEDGTDRGGRQDRGERGTPD